MLNFKYCAFPCFEFYKRGLKCGGSVTLFKQLPIMVHDQAFCIIIWQPTTLHRKSTPIYYLRMPWVVQWVEPWVPSTIPSAMRNRILTIVQWRCELQEQRNKTRYSDPCISTLPCRWQINKMSIFNKQIIKHVKKWESK